MTEPLTMLSDFLSLIAPDHAANMNGIYSVCSAHPDVLRAAMQKAVADRSVLLIETTPNQVNQFGGYSGMTPSGFKAMVSSLASHCGLPLSRLLLGADHLGPYVWRKSNRRQAMQYAIELTRAFVTAGYHKLHLDAGMALRDDPGPNLPHETVIKRSLQMLTAAEEAKALAVVAETSPIYVIGAEAPVPGGGVDSAHATIITPSEEIAVFMERFQRALNLNGLMDVWQRIAAVVVQPGVDFGDRQVVVYDRTKAAGLLDFVRTLPSHMTCEVHATDYQPPEALITLIKDGFRILKVGPCLTSAYRQAIFALARIEQAWYGPKKSGNLSDIDTIVDQVMQSQPQHWQSHYHGTLTQQAWLRRHSLRDRIRYYWRHPKVATALSRLINNLSFDIPEEILRTHWPDAPSDPVNRYPLTLITQHIGRRLNSYAAACIRTDD